MSARRPAAGDQAAWPTWPRRRRLPARGADRLLASALLIWALFDVPWWWRPPGHAGSTPLILGMLGLAAAPSLPFPCPLHLSAPLILGMLGRAAAQSLPSPPAVLALGRRRRRAPRRWPTRR